MFSYKFYIREEKNDSLMLRVTNNRRKAEMSMGLQISQTELDSALAGTSGNIRLEKMLTSWTMQIKDLMLELSDRKESDKDVKEIRTILQERLLGVQQQQQKEIAANPNGNFVPFFEIHTEGYAKRSTRESNEYTLSVMRKYCAGISSLNFEDINYAWLADFDKFMDKAGLSVNTRRIHFANIRAAINDAYKRELTDADPFRRFKLKKEKTAKRSLPVDELRKLFNYPVEPHAEYFRDMFKLIFMLMGINTVDLYGLDEIFKDSRIEYRRAKTGRLYSVKVEPEALEIINRYKGVAALLNIADKYKDHRYFRRDTNDALRLIGEVKRAGRGGKKVYKPLWPELTTYWARHSWATIAADLDIPDAVISQALGHSNAGVTEIYIRRNLKKVDEANRRVLDWVLYGKR